MTNPNTWMWVKRGDALSEGSDLCAAFVQEAGQAGADDDVSVRRAKTPAGNVYTVILAGHPWWHERMRVHPQGWHGRPFSEIIDLFDL
jgi:hypothetical protein